MNYSLLRYALYAVPAMIVALLVLLMEAMPLELGRLSAEDGPVEDLTAASFVIATVGFAVAAWRAPMLYNTGRVWTPAMTICWALLMFVCFGEEISWGQRVFDVATPQYLERVNDQQEINVHDIGFVNDFLGGTHRWMSIYMWMTGLGLPFLALTNVGKSLLGYFRFPVSPWSYSVLFVGAYLYGAYYRVWFPIPDMTPPNAPTEIRELLMGLGSAFFAVHTALWPRDVYTEGAYATPKTSLLQPRV